jgi:hypothetical protein
MSERIEKQKKHAELEKMTNRQVIIRIDPKTKEEYLSGHCVCPNTWHRVSIVDGHPYFGCSRCGCEASFIGGKWTTGTITPMGFMSDKEVAQALI